jgi:hypothetical protein
MNQNCEIESSELQDAIAARQILGGKMQLGELVELVASILPEEEVSDTVCALFDSGLVSFARILSRDQREALQKRD